MGFFHWIVLRECFQMYVNGILLSLTIFEIIGVKGAKMYFG